MRRATTYEGAPRSSKPETTGSTDHAGATDPSADPPPRRLRRSAPARRIGAGAPRTERSLLPDPRLPTERLAQAIVEVLAGARPAAQLAGLTSFEVLRFLTRGAGRLGARPGGPPQRPVIGSVRITEPSPGVIEASAVIHIGVRVRALALRLEGIDGRWRCTAIHLG